MLELLDASANGLQFVVNPYERSCYFQRQTDWGRMVVTAPSWPLPEGYRLKYPAECFE